MSALIRLYPAAWRERYEAEFLDLLEARPPTLGDRFDILRGALDARVRPQVQGTPQDPITDVDLRFAAIRAAATSGLVEYCYADVEQPRDPFAVRGWRPHGDREVERARHRGHFADGVDRQRRVLHVDTREVEAGRLHQHQDRRIAHQGQPGADLRLAALDAGPHAVAQHVFPCGKVPTLSVKHTACGHANACPLVPTNAGTQFCSHGVLSIWPWIPACAGMSGETYFAIFKSWMRMMPSGGCL